MISYLLEASAYLTAFYLLYYVGLRRDTFFERNRAYLLGSALAATLLPWFELPANPMVATIPLPDWSLLSTSAVRSTEIPMTNGLTITDFIHYGYYTIVGLLALRFTCQLVQIGRIIYQHRVTVHPGYRLVHTGGQIPLASFFSFIFWNTAVPIDSNMSDLLIKHELQHVRGRHTYDLMALRLLKIIFWFNPVVYFYYRSLQAQHEYIADRAVIANALTEHYQQLLIGHLFNNLSIPLTHRFNQVLLKTRIAMMNRPRTSRPRLLTPLLAIPLAIALSLFYSTGTAQLAFRSLKETPINTLYLHCGNPLTLDLPDAVGEVSYNIQGGELLSGKKLHQVIIVPNQTEVTLQVLNGQKIVKDYHFQVRRVPLPSIVLRHNITSSPHDIRISPAQVATLSIHAIPDEDLGRFLPRDARFKLLGTVSLVRNEQILRTLTLDGRFDPGALGAVQAGDEIRVAVDKVLRKDFRNKIEELETAQVLRAIIL